jgi:hypothetical protein
MNALWILKGIAIAIVAAVVLGFVVMYLWNWLAPRVFNLPTIQFKHALGILLLSKILFGGFGGGHWRGHHGQHFEQKQCQEWKMQHQPKIEEKAN